MQTKQVLETIRRLEVEFRPIRDRLSEIRGIIHGDPRKVVDRHLNRQIIEATYELSHFIEATKKDSDAVHVLTAFGLGKTLLDKAFWIDITSTLPFGSSNKEFTDQNRIPLIESWQKVYELLLGPFSLMVDCVKPLTTLTIPTELLTEHLQEDILAVNLSERETLDVKTLAKVFSEIESLYDTIQSHLWVHWFSSPSDPKN